MIASGSLVGLTLIGVFTGKTNTKAKKQLLFDLRKRGDWDNFGCFLLTLVVYGMVGITPLTRSIGEG